MFRPLPAKLLIALAVSGAYFPCAIPARSQPPAPAVQPDPNAPRRPLTLSEVVGEMRWNVEQNGPLLVVGPEETGMTFRATGPPPPLPPRSPSGLPLQRIEAYFERRVVNCGSIAALAPLNMTVLNYKSFPKPSAYAGVRGADRLRFLLASLTPAQWRTVGSMDGLGRGDLDKDQRELWEGILAPGYGIWRQDEANAPREVPITSQMVNEMRFHMARTVSYQLRQGNSLTSRSRRETGPAWRLMEIHSQESVEAERHKFLGQALTSEVPARAKPGDLDFSWQGFDPLIRLEDAKTVGDLVERIAAAAKIELLCDARYRTLTVHTRGEQARAGDLLKALCRGLTGTVRRVGGERGAFVLTNDLVGYGTRRAIIRDWIEQNNALIAARDRKITAALKKARPTRYLSYEPGDPMTPNDKVLTKVAAFKVPTLTAEDTSQPDWPLKRYCWVPVADLPPDSQAQVRAQIAELQKEAEQTREFGDRGVLHTEAVVPRFESETYFFFPGIGKVKADNWGDLSSYFEEPDPYRANEMIFLWEKKPLTARIARRAVTAWMEAPADGPAIARAARRAGFTELWIDVPVDGDRDAYLKLLALAVKAAKAEGLTARVLVRVLRPGVLTKTALLTPERNVQGETWAQAMTRLLARPAIDISGGFISMNPETADAGNQIVAETLAREKRTGDWLSLPTPDQRPALRSGIAEIAALPGVDGLVLRDMQPPGFNERPMFSGSSGMDISDLGYTPERRLRFLKQTGVDPIDLSGSGTNARYNMMGSSTDVNLPWFPSERLGNISQQWDSLCRNEGEQAIHDLFADLRRASGSVPVWLYRSPVDPTGMAVYILYVESMDKPAAFTALPAPVASAPNNEPTFVDPTASARKRSSLVLTTLQCQPIGSSLSQTDQFLMEISGLADPKYDPFQGYDGLVVDLNRRTPDAIRLHLEALPPFVPARPARAKP